MTDSIILNIYNCICNCSDHNLDGQSAIVNYINCFIAGECISFNDLKNLPWLFQGKAGLQHDTYLHMRNCTG